MSEKQKSKHYITFKGTFANARRITSAPLVSAFFSRRAKSLSGVNEDVASTNCYHELLAEFVSAWHPKVDLYQRISKGIYARIQPGRSNGKSLTLSCLSRSRDDEPVFICNSFDTGVSSLTRYYLTGFSTFRYTDNSFTECLFSCPGGKLEIGKNGKPAHPAPPLPGKKNNKAFFEEMRNSLKAQIKLMENRIPLSKNASENPWQLTSIKPHMSMSDYYEKGVDTMSVINRSYNALIDEVRASLDAINKELSARQQQPSSESDLKIEEAASILSGTVTDLSMRAALQSEIPDRLDNCLHTKSILGGQASSIAIGTKEDGTPAAEIYKEISNPIAERKRMNSYIPFTRPQTKKSKTLSTKKPSSTYNAFSKGKRIEKAGCNRGMGRAPSTYS